MLMSIVSLMGIVFAFPLTTHAADITVSVKNTGWAEAAAPNLWGGGTIQGGRNIFVLYVAPETILYCLEPGAPLNSGDGVNVGSYADTLRTPSIHEDGAVTRLLGRLFQYVDYSGTGSALVTDDGKALYVAARMLVWELTQGERDENFNYVAPPAGYNRVREFVDNSTMAQGYKNLIYTYYNYLVDKVQNHHRIPSFTRMSQPNAPLYELTDNNCRLQVTLNDTAGVLGNYNFSAGGISFSKNGNQLTASTGSAFSGEVMVTASHTTAQRRGVICYGDGAGNLQDTAVIGSPIDDPIRAFFRLKVAVGHLNIVKTTKNNDGLVGGFQFEVKKGDANIGTFTSAADGRIHIPNLVVGNYTVREVGLSDEFVQPTPNPVSVTVRSGQTSTVNFNNIKKMGVITVQKSNANPVMGDYPLTGAEFTVKNANGTVVDTIITGADGKGQSKALRLGNYTVQEVKAPWGYVIDRNIYHATLSGSLGVAEIVYAPAIPVPQRPQTGQVRITKLDAETGATPQGDATLAGAVFDLLDAKGKQVERIYCGANSFAISKEVPLGSYIVREVTPPVGYTLTTKEYPITIDYAGQEVEIHLVPQDVANTVIRGRIQLVKHSDDPDPQVDPENEQVQQPLGGIVFEVYLKAAGSFEAAKETERELLTTDENGYARTKDLPYGIYTVREIQGAPEHTICAPFDVFISQNDRTYFYIVENPAYYGKVKVVKTDAETGSTIPVPNIEFKKFNVDTGEWVAQEILYPTPIVIDSYLTNAEGWLVMPKPLLHGNYELHEVQAPHGYVLSETPVPFTVTSDNSVEFLEVVMPNMPVKGTVSLQKTGEVLTGANEIETESGSIFVPEYSVRGIEGAVFDIIAAEDIITPDGTVRAAQGEVVDTITTGADGLATSKELYLGNYYAVETFVPHGFVLDETPLPFSLVYVDQHTPLVTAETGLYNERAKAAVEVIKTAESVELDEDGAISYVQTPVQGIVFGLYAREAISNVDGEEIIPAGALMDVLTTGEDGTVMSTQDIPFGSYYVKEIATYQNLVPSDTEYDVVVEYADSATPLVTVTVNEGMAVENYLIKGKIKVIKKDDLGNPLAGVEFSITGEATGYTSTLVTDDNGEAVTGLLPYDRYTIVETKTQAGYVLDKMEHTLLLSQDGETYEFGIINQRIRGRVKVIKTDGKDRAPLAGVAFVLKDAGGTLVATLTTGADGVALSDELAYGKYTLTETATGAAYVLDATPHEISIAEHEKVVELRLENHKKQGKIAIVKVDGESKAPLEGVVFEVFDAEEKLVATLVTDKDGTASTDWLDYGAYTVKEKTAKEGYVLDGTVHEVLVVKDQTVYTLTLQNSRVPEQPQPPAPTPPTNPKTGDDSNVALWIGLFLLAVAGLAGLGIYVNAKKQNDDENTEENENLEV